MVDAWKPQRSARSRTVAFSLACCVALPVIKPFEGRVKHSYPDIVYGWKKTSACDGHTGPELRAGMTFTDAECDEMDKADLRKTYDGLERCFGDAQLSTNELGAYLSLGYNIGAGAVCDSSIPKKIKGGQHGAACATITEFYKIGKLDCRIASNHCSGIPRRRAAERALCERQ